MCRRQATVVGWAHQIRPHERLTQACDGSVLLVTND
jgi:hypothetical protein